MASLLLFSINYSLGGLLDGAAISLNNSHMHANCYAINAQKNNPISCIVALKAVGGRHASSNKGEWIPIKYHFELRTNP